VLGFSMLQARAQGFVFRIPRQPFTSMALGQVAGAMQGLADRLLPSAFLGKAMAGVEYERGPAGERLAFVQDGPPDDFARAGFFWLGGFMSDMQGAKAEALAALARETRRPNLRFDYSGHGKSSGEFVDGTISRWLEQAIHMFIARTLGKRIVVGSSMGAWLAMLLLRTLMRDDPMAAKRIAGLVLIAPAADMTRDLMWNDYSEEARHELVSQGLHLQPSGYGEPYPITYALIEDGERHLILEDGLSLRIPVRILQGSADVDVPPTHALKVFGALNGPDITMTLIKGGDHRLSTPGQLASICSAALHLAERADGMFN
jgi:pimeloyl-ACP methyl ester carboxylesterase